MAINIYTVQQEAETNGWELVSETYQNLQTELKWKCPFRHDVIMSYGDWRKTHTCPLCETSTSFKIVRNQIPKKKENTFRVLSLDAATGTTGWAIFDDNKLVCYGTFNTSQLKDSIEKIIEVKNWLLNLIKTSQIDAIGLENIQLQENVKTFQTLANLQGVLLSVIFEHDIPYCLGYSSEWRTYCGLNNADKRDQAKKKAQLWIQELYGIKPTQDEADAICMGKYFTHKLKKPSQSWGEKI